MGKNVSVSIRNNSFVLHPKKAAYWEQQQLLLVADMHLGKVTHFRKSGIAVPRKKMDEDLLNLEKLLDEFKPSSVCFLGDLFHSDYNREAELLESFVQHFTSIQFQLVLGNHDHPRFRREMSAILQIHDRIEISGFSLQHHPGSDQPGTFQICGHIHPAVRLKGPSNQKLKLPCFYLKENMMVLPSFGSFTGSQIVKVDKQDRIFVVADGKVVEM